MDAEDDSQLAFLLLPPGERDSGRARYAAAMHFNRSHRLSHAALEVFRILAKEDNVSPRGIFWPPAALPTNSTPSHMDPAHDRRFPLCPAL
jgi:hypothetical protein